MRKIRVALLLPGLIFFSTVLFSQEQKGISLLNGEFIFSFSNFTNSHLRFSAFPNLNYPVLVLVGRNKPYLIESGINIRNTGIIYKNGSVKYKIRSISLGIPVKFSLPVKKPGIFVGAELDYSFFSKEKIISGSDKEKKTAFFSKKINSFRPAFTAEIVLTKDIRLKGSYYVSDFFNSDFSETINGSAVQPYLKSSNIFYVSVVTGLFFVTTRPTIVRLFNN